MRGLSCPSSPELCAIHHYSHVAVVPNWFCAYLVSTLRCVFTASWIATCSSLRIRHSQNVLGPHYIRFCQAFSLDVHVFDHHLLKICRCEVKKTTITFLPSFTCFGVSLLTPAITCLCPPFMTGNER